MIPVPKGAKEDEVKNVRAVTLMAVGLAISLSALAQTQESNLWKPKEKPDKIDFFCKVSKDYFRVTTVFDMSVTVVRMSHPAVAHFADGRSVFYPTVENDWAGPIVGRRNTFGVVALNVAQNVAIGWTSRYFERKGGKWRFLAIGLNVLGTKNLVAGIHDVRYNADESVRLATGERGPVTWTRR